MYSIVCSICWETIKKDDDLLGTSCGHIFHAGCIQRWLLQSPTCPQCRVGCRTQKFFLTFEISVKDISNGRAVPTAKNSIAETSGEVNRNIFTRENIEQLEKEMHILKVKHRMETESYRNKIETLEGRIANLEVTMHKAMAKEKTLSEGFHYKLQDLKTEFHYKSQDLKIAKEEFLDTLAKSKNFENQLHYNIDEARRVEDQLRKSLLEYSTKHMELETEKAKLQSKLDASERSVRWLKHSLNELHKGVCGCQVHTCVLKSNGIHLDSIDTSVYEEEERRKHAKLEQRQYHLKDQKFKKTQRETKRSLDICILT